MAAVYPRNAPARQGSSSIFESVDNKFDTAVRRTCAQPQLSVRTQLQRAFISLTVIPLSLVFIAAAISADAAGNTAYSTSSKKMEEMTLNSLRQTARMNADVLEKRLENIKNVGYLIEQALIDRVHGYVPGNPSAAYINDTGIPFAYRNVETGASAPADGRGLYPFEMPETYLDYVCTDYASCAALNIPGLQNGPPRGRELVSVHSLERSVFHWPGTCDPAAGADPATLGYTYYLDGCTNANNVIDFETELLRDKTSHLDYFLKPLKEAVPELLGLGVYLNNNGKGALRYYPGLFPIPFSEGYYPCTYNLETDQCEPGTVQTLGRNYNPLERPFFQKAMAYPGRMLPSSPYISTWAGADSTVYLVSYAKSIYDRQTGELIGCVSVDIETSTMSEVTDNIELGKSGLAHLLEWSASGTVVASPEWTDKTSKLSATDLQGINAATWEKMLASDSNGIDLDKQFEITRSGKPFYATRAPIPLDAEVPEFMLVLIISEGEIQDPLADMKDKIDTTVGETIGVTAIITAVVMVISVLSTLLIAQRITAPLQYLTTTANKIIDNAAGDLAEGVDADQGAQFGNDDEIGELVVEFNKMISGLGSKGGASAVINTEVVMVDNKPFSGPKPYSQLMRQCGLQAPNDVMLANNVRVVASANMQVTALPAQIVTATVMGVSNPPGTTS